MVTIYNIRNGSIRRQIHDFLFDDNSNVFRSLTIYTMFAKQIKCKVWPWTWRSRSRRWKIWLTPFDWKCSVLYRWFFIQNFSFPATYVYAKGCTLTRVRTDTHTASLTGDDYWQNLQADLPKSKKFQRISQWSYNNSGLYNSTSHLLRIHCILTKFVINVNSPSMTVIDRWQQDVARIQGTACRWAINRNVYLQLMLFVGDAPHKRIRPKTGGETDDV